MTIDRKTIHKYTTSYIQFATKKKRKKLGHVNRNIALNHTKSKTLITVKQITYQIPISLLITNDQRL